MEKKTVLIVDDAIFMRIIMKKMIDLDGRCQVVGEAVNGYEAIELAKTLQPDIMTMDIVMPECDGVSAIKKILEVSPNTKIIMVSSVGNYKIVQESIEQGAYDYLVKPIIKEEISGIIERIVNA